MSCPQAMSFFSTLCPVPFSPVSKTQLVLFFSKILPSHSTNILRGKGEILKDSNRKTYFLPIILQVCPSRNCPSSLRGGKKKNRHLEIKEKF